MGSKLTSLDLSGCSSLSLPQSIGNLSNLTSLNLSDCYNLESLPSSIGTLSNLTSLNLSRCGNLSSIPTSLSHLKIPLIIAGLFRIPSDMDWSQFKREVNVASYMEYMMRRNKISSILSHLSEYVSRFDSEDSLKFKGYEISTVYELIERREGRGNDLIGYLCLMLTNDWKMKRESGYVNEIVEWRNNAKKRDGMKYLKILFLTVCGWK